VPNFARKFLPRRLYDAPINNIVYVVKTPTLRLYASVHGGLYK